MKFLIDLFLDVWLYIALLLGAVLVVQLIRNWKKWTWMTRLTALAVITLVLHTWEEWRIPGGFFYLYNLGSYQYPMNQLTDSITNLAGIVLGTIVVFRWGSTKISSFAIIGICLVEVFAHLIHQPQNMETYFGAFYNPGMVTTIIGYIPVCIGLILCLVKDPPHRKDVVLGIVAFVLVNSLTVIAPEALLKSPENPYGFTDKRYFNRFETLLPNDPAYQSTSPEITGLLEGAGDAQAEDAVTCGRT